MKDLIEKAGKFLDMDFIRKHTVELNKLEINTDNAGALISTDYVCKLLADAGFEDVERYALPCDGVTTYDDCTMPMAWDRTGRSTLEIIEPALPENERMLADTDVQPVNAVIWSPPTPPGGITAELISLKDITSDDLHEAGGKIVLCHRTPIGDLRRKLATCGAMGLVSYVENTLDTNPDDVRWMNGVGMCGWYYVKGDPMIWNFSITPRRGEALQKRLAAGEKIVLKAVMNTRVYDGEIYSVTARIPGKSDEELALWAHMYEPFLADDAAGVVIPAAIGKALNELVANGTLPPLEKSIRVFFSMERYGFSEFFHNRKRSGKIISAINMDSVCHRTLELAGVLPELRSSPSSAPCFDTALLREILRKNYPEFPFRETPGNLSDDTFSAEEPFNIPCCWLHTPPAVERHHNTGEIFAGIDWQIAEMVGYVMAAYLAETATVTAKRGGRDLARRMLKGIKLDAVKEFKRLAESLKDHSVNSYAGNVIGDHLVQYFTGRMTSLNRLVKGLINKREMEKTFAEIRRKYAPESLKCDIYELRNSETRMAYMYIKRPLEIRQYMSLTRMPSDERRGFIARPQMLLYALLDGKRSLYEAYVISNFMLNRKNDFKETAGLVHFFKKIAPYGYCEITTADSINVNDVKTALDALGVAAEDKVVVHSAYGSLGGLEGGPEALVETLIDRCGKSGLLMMPSFNFPYYMGRNNDEYFDVLNTPSVVGAISEAFRKHPEVVRSLNPSHSMAVYGKENFHWISDDHKTLCFGRKSPLAKLEDADGYALMINCSNAVTFMHVVEMTNKVHCVGRRNEELNVKLPDGRIEKVRTWGWRGASCRAYNNDAIYEYMRKKGWVTEVMVRHSLWQYFKLSDYRKAYEKVVLRNPDKGCMACDILPRVFKNTVPSDWDSENEVVRSNTSAFVGDWEWKTE